MGRVVLLAVGVEYFRCRCGRSVPFDMMLDVSAVDGVPRGEDAYRCDGCWRRWLFEGQITPDELRRQTEQPARAERKPW